MKTEIFKNIYKLPIDPTTMITVLTRVIATNHQIKLINH